MDQQGGIAPMATTTKLQSPYGVEEWGAGYFAINGAGHLAVCPYRDGRQVSLIHAMRRCGELGITPPIHFRFPQILETQLGSLYACFDQVIRETGYEGTYRSVFPLKVNPHRAVVEALSRAGRPHAFGLEIGSKGELAIALAQDLPPGSWICINGFKDEQIMRMAVAASGRDPQIVLVVERLAEVPTLLKEIQTQGRSPVIGLRCRLHSRGSGRWEASGGEAAKFGLNTTALFAAIDQLRAANVLDRLQVLHYHVGSQITSVRRIKNAVKEAARIYAKLRSRGVPLTTLNVGGGLGVDYDGSGTTSDSSVNYSFQEFANNVVYTVQEVCAEEAVAMPDLVSESGRVLVAHHALLVTNCESRESDIPVDYKPSWNLAAEDVNGGSEENEEEIPTQLRYLEELAGDISVKNFREYYHDALEVRTEILNLFDLGYISIEYRARADQYFYQICRSALLYARQTRYVSDEFKVMEKAFRETYVGNFSVFYSAPDSWAIEQLFPVLPIHRLHETPTQQGILVDLTCDSDGVIDSFIDVREVKEMLELHATGAGQPYLLALCLLGAYQEVMGDHHNLFGRPPEVIVTLDGQEPRLEVFNHGETIAQMARLAGYEPAELSRQFAARFGAAVPGQRFMPERLYEQLWDTTSYMQGDPERYRQL